MPEISNLADTGIRHRETTDITLDWRDPKLKQIIRIRYIGDSWAGPFDLSYCLGVDTEGRQVRVRIPVYQVYGRGATVIQELVRAAKRDKVYLKALCGGDIRGVLSIHW